MMISIQCKWALTPEYCCYLLTTKAKPFAKEKHVQNVFSNDFKYLKDL